jgi:NADH:flavin oxidoreductase / NADH oxidase family
MPSYPHLFQPLQAGPVTLKNRIVMGSMHTRLARSGIRLKTGHRVSAGELAQASNDAVVLASGVRPRLPGIPGIGHPKVLRYDDEGLHILHDGRPKLLEVDHVVLCAGQEPVNALRAELAAKGIDAALIGGAGGAEEIDALRAMEQGMKFAYAL